MTYLQRRKTFHLLKARGQQVSLGRATDLFASELWLLLPCSPTSEVHVALEATDFLSELYQRPSQCRPETASSFGRTSRYPERAGLVHLLREEAADAVHMGLRGIVLGDLRT